MMAAVFNLSYKIAQWFSFVSITLLVLGLLCSSPQKRRGEIFPGDRAFIYPFIDLVWTEKWSKVKIHIDSNAVANGLVRGLQETELESSRWGVWGGSTRVDLWEWELSLLIFVYHVNSHQRTSTKRRLCTIMAHSVEISKLTLATQVCA